MLGIDRTQSSAMTSIKQPSFRIEDDEDLVREQERKGLSQLDRLLQLGDWGRSVPVELPQAPGHFTFGLPGRLRTEAPVDAEADSWASEQGPKG